MLELILIRHPPTVGNEERRIQGQINAQLKDDFGIGVDQVAEKLLSIGNVNAIFCSDAQRSRIPGERMFNYLKQYGNIDFVSTPLLRERNSGDYENMRYDELDSRHQNPRKYLFLLDEIPNGENHNQIGDRVINFDETFIQGREGRIAIIGHGQYTNYQLNYYKTANILKPGYFLLKNLTGIRLLMDNGKILASRKL